MATPAKIRGEVDSLLRLLIDNNIALYISRVVMRKQETSSIRVTWPSRSQNWRLGFGKPFGSIDEYFAWLENGEYSAILFDGSMLQISFDFRWGDLIAHRLVYYPCPIELSNEEQMLLRELPVVEVIDAYAGALDRFRTKSPIRFDFDAEAGTSAHPASHMTMLTNDCRLPVYGPLSLGHFVTFVFRNFYPRLCERHKFVREWPARVERQTIEPSDQHHLHIWTRNRSA